MTRSFLLVLSAAWALCFGAGAAAADPPDLKTLAIGAKAPDFHLPGVDGKTYSLADFAAGEGPGRDLHLQPLPDRPGLRRTDRPARGRLSRQGGRRRGDLAQRSRRRPARRAGLYRSRRLVRGHEDPRQGSRLRLSVSLRRRDAGDRPGVRRAGHAARLHLRRRAQAPLRRPIRRRRGQGGQVARRQERRRGPAGRQAGPGGDDPRLRLLDQVGRQAGRRPQIAGEVGRRAGRARADRLGRRGQARQERHARSSCS